MKKILMFGTFDSKGNEFRYLYEEIRRRNFEVVSMNTGVYKAKGDFPIDISAEKVAEAGGVTLDTLRRKADRGTAMRVMCLGAKKIVVNLCGKHKICGAISMGGGGNIYSIYSNASPATWLPKSLHYNTCIRRY